MRDKHEPLGQSKNLPSPKTCRNAHCGIMSFEPPWLLDAAAPARGSRRAQANDQEDKRTSAMAVAGLLEMHEFVHLLKPPRKKRQRRPSFARMARLARKLGLDVEVSRDGVMTLKASQGNPNPRRQSIHGTRCCDAPQIQIHPRVR